MSGYEKAKAWAGLLFGIYLITQSFALVVWGGVLTGENILAVGLPVLLMGLLAVYVGYRFARWGWKNI